MEKALRTIAKLRSNLVTDESLLRAAWKLAIGPKLEARARFRELVRDRIVVEVDDRVWQSQLHSLQKPILAKLEKLTGGKLVRQIEYRVAIPRPLPQPALEPAFALVSRDPEATKIANPTLRRIYLQSKRRAHAS